MIAFQSDVSYEMQNLSEELEWPWVWENEVEHPHRVYYSDLASVPGETDFDFSTPEYSSVDLLEMAKEAGGESLGDSVIYQPHINNDGEVDLNPAFMTIHRSEPDEKHWFLSLSSDTSIKIYVTGVPLDRKYRNPLRILYNNLLGGTYWNTVANHGGV